MYHCGGVRYTACEPLLTSVPYRFIVERRQILTQRDPCRLPTPYTSEMAHVGVCSLSLVVGRQTSIEVINFI